MPILMRRSGSLNKQIQKVGRRAKKLYPDIRWSIQLPSPEILEAYGEGFVMMARMGNRMSEYFILKEDPRIDNWIHMMAIELDPQIQEDSSQEFRGTKVPKEDN